MPAFLGGFPGHTEKVKENQNDPWREKRRKHIFILWGAVQVACGSGLDPPWERVTILCAFLEVESELWPLPKEGA